MMKKSLRHSVAIVLFVGFVVLALGSFESSPSSYSSSPTPKQKCTTCDGLGHVRCWYCNATGKVYQDNCPKCGGRAILICDACKGTGQR